MDSSSRTVEDGSDGGADSGLSLEDLRLHLLQVLHSGRLPDGAAVLVRSALESESEGRMRMAVRAVSRYVEVGHDADKVSRWRNYLRRVRLSPFLEAWQQDVIDHALRDGGDASGDNVEFAVESIEAGVDLVDHARRALSVIARGSKSIPGEHSERAAQALGEHVGEEELLGVFEALLQDLPHRVVLEALDDPLRWEAATELPGGWEARKESLVFSSGADTFAWLPKGIMESFLGLVDTDFVSLVNVRKFIDYTLRFVAKHGGLVQCVDQREGVGAWPCALLFNLGHRDNRTREELFGICVQNRRPDSSHYVFKFQTQSQLVQRSAFLDEVELPPLPGALLPGPPDFRGMAMRHDPQLHSFYFDTRLPLLGAESNFRHLHGRISRVEGMHSEDIAACINHSFWRVRCRPYLATPQWNRGADNMQLLLPLYPAPRTRDAHTVISYRATDEEEPVGAMVVSAVPADGDTSAAQGYRVATLLNIIDAFNNAKLVVHTPPDWLRGGIRRQLGLNQAEASASGAAGAAAQQSLYAQPHSAPARMPMELAPQAQRAAPAAAVPPEPFGGQPGDSAPGARPRLAKEQVPQPPWRATETAPPPPPPRLVAMRSVPVSGGGGNHRAAEEAARQQRARLLQEEEDKRRDLNPGAQTFVPGHGAR